MKTVKNPVWGNADETMIYCDVDFGDKRGEMPMLVSANYDTAEGRSVFDEIVNGDHGPIGGYVAPKPPTAAEKRASAKPLKAHEIRLALIEQDVMPKDVQAYIDGISDDTERAVLDTLWNYGHTFTRTDETLNEHLSNLGITAAKADKVFGIS